VTEQQTGTSRLRRMLSRGLFVVGGTVAATATAWLISSAPASADTLPAAPAPPVASSGVLGAVTGTTSGTTSLVTGTVEQLAAPVAQVAAPVAHTVTPVVTQTAAAVLAPPAAPAKLDKVTGALTDTVHQLRLTDDLAGHLAAPDVTAGLTRILPVAAPTTRPVAPSTGHQTAPTAAAPPAAHPVVGSSTAPTAALSTAHAGRRPAHATALGLHHSAGGSPATRHSSHRAPAPFAPPASPASSSGNGGQQGPGNPTVGVAFGLPAVPGLNVVRVPAPTDAPAPVMPGKQPGVTPD
jgi:hypothetical protein